MMMNIDNLLKLKSILEENINKYRQCDNQLQITINQNNLIDVLHELGLAGVQL